MKTKILFLVMIGFFTTNLDAQITRRYGSLSVNLDGFEGYTVPPLFLSADLVFKDTYSLEVGVPFSYASSEIYGIKTTTMGSGVYFGANYYLNNLLKLNMDKYTVSAGAGITWATVLISSDSEYIGTSSSSSFNFGANVKGRYFFTPRFGVIGQVNFAKGGTAIYAGLTFFTSRK